ncbi:hypothetical protein GH808_14470 [Acetobacterium fimetarium]|uniref:Glycosyl transferase family 11 n=1 Tax=Acetobacterium fimetarium TaxID=52691 RepID=A0ABR6WYF0_9FIRM|nr:alpha-1,2-fucosyltransferase [Acetobacterium fimetarium]MBC3805611.1 hypothetical protein [Acetobacterium fimetarium]
MKIVKFRGGYGNQLFQYSFLRELQLKYNCEDVKADLAYFSTIKENSVYIPRIEKLNVKIDRATQADLSTVCILKHTSDPSTLIYRAGIIFEKIFNHQYYLESDRAHRDIESILGYQYYDGYWQSWKHLNGIENELRNEITLKEKMSEKSRNAIDKFSSENSVFIGIRRGDYLATSRLRRHFGSYDNAYFNKAIGIMKEKVADPVFYVFSNDIDWIKENMRFDCKVNYREFEDQTSDTEELFVMSACKHAIIVNSTFYWWGAWLIENEQKTIIAPQRWFADGSPIDIVPDTWIKI